MMGCGREAITGCFYYLSAFIIIRPMGRLIQWVRGRQGALQAIEGAGACGVGMTVDAAAFCEPTP